jgi:hypothetical protein
MEVFVSTETKEVTFSREIIGLGDRSLSRSAMWVGSAASATMWVGNHREALVGIARDHVFNGSQTNKPIMDYRSALVKILGQGSGSGASGCAGRT